ncbi:MULTISPECIES: DUF928 domain-containing protein [Cyanophyceae]|uniref:DUF928 domain-containing protein n=1 Tax=Stenomitos frigidus AS-A4 TaxID=2933935 RepID=A0ABV0KR27_9CYAN|nr:DUF928 domain-containing protein [Phormidium sp. FACHB-592]
MGTINFISPLGLQAKPLTKMAFDQQYAQYVPPKPRRPLGRPKNRRFGGASRNGCAAIKADQSLLTALIPDDEFIYTIAERPTFWFYIPYSAATIANVKFVLQDAADPMAQSLYPQSEDVILPQGKQPGVIGIRLPATSTPLQVGKTYRWTLKVHCGEQSANAEPVYVQGTVERMMLTPALQRQLQAQRKQPREQMLLYARNGIWYEALTTLAELRRDRPRDPKLLADWQKLLQTIGLQDVSNKPLAPCCTLSR